MNERWGEDIGGCGAHGDDEQGIVFKGLAVVVEDVRRFRGTVPSHSVSSGCTLVEAAA